VSEEKFNVKTQSYEDLTEDERHGVSNNGSGAEYATYLRIVRDGVTIYLESDACEPEDARLSRDYSWVKKAIQDAYSFGLEDGRNSP
jgi:hypothetical protein